MNHVLSTFVQKKRKSQRQNIVGLFVLTGVAAIVIAETLKQAQANIPLSNTHNDVAAKTVAMFDQDQTVENNVSIDPEKIDAPTFTEDSLTGNSEPTLLVETNDAELNSQVEFNSHVIALVNDENTLSVTKDETSLEITPVTEETLNSELSIANDHSASLSGEMTDGFAMVTAASGSAPASTGAEESGGVSPWMILGGVGILGGGAAALGGGGGGGASGGGSTSTGSSSTETVFILPDGEEMTQERIAAALQVAGDAGISPEELSPYRFQSQNNDDVESLTHFHSELLSVYGLDEAQAAEVIAVIDYVSFSLHELEVYYDHKIWEQAPFQGTAAELQAYIEQYEQDHGLDVAPAHEILLDNIVFFDNELGQLVDDSGPMSLDDYANAHGGDYTSAVVITEIMTNTQDIDVNGSPDTDLQWIEIFNPGEEALSLLNMNIVIDGNSSTLQGNLVINPGDYLLLSSNPDLSGLIGESNGWIAQGVPFDAQNGSISLDFNGSVIDQVDYDVNNINGGDMLQEGQSIAFVDIDLYTSTPEQLAQRNDDMRYWAPSTETYPSNDPQVTIIGTPGEDNIDYGMI